MKRKNNNDEKFIRLEIMDKYSDLPEAIAQHILSFLPTEEAIEASLLSKTWLSASSKLHNLDLNYSRFQDKYFAEDYTWELCDFQFVKFVDSTLRRRCMHNDICIDKFKLSTNFSCRKLLSVFEDWLEIVLTKNVKHLSIRLDFPRELGSFYTLYQTILTSNSLVVLKLRGYLDTIFSLGHQVVKKCYNLKKLHIEGVMVEESTLGNLSSIFPCIEVLKFIDCFAMGDIELSGLLNLKEFEVKSSGIGQMVKLSEALSLESFTYLSSEIYGFNPQYFYITPCQGLKYIWLTNSSITNSCFNNIISQCPLLEELELEWCTELETISISSQKLESVTLCKLSHLEEVKIDAPNLTYLYYEGQAVPSFSLIKRSKNLECIVRLNRSDTDSIGSSFFVKLRRLLTDLSPSKVTLSIGGEIRVDIEELRKVQVLDPKPKLENLKLHIYSHSSTLLDGLWWSCCPAKLTVSWNHRNLDSIQFLCKELMDTGFRDCCSSDDQIKCWRHYLNKVEAVYFQAKEDQPTLTPHLLDWKSLVNRQLAVLEKFRIQYRLDWQSS